MALLLVGLGSVAAFGLLLAGPQVAGPARLFGVAALGLVALLAAYRVLLPRGAGPEGRFSLAFERMIRPALIVRPGPEDGFVVVAANAAATALAGGAEGVRGRPITAWSDRLHLDDVRPVLRSVRDTGTPGTVSTVGRRDADGSERWFELEAFPGAPGEIVLLVRDSTDERASIAALRTTGEELRRLHEAQQRKLEGERRRIAQEVHDELGQVATALTLGLDRLERRVTPVDPQLAAAAARLKELSASTVDTVRRICAKLRPSQLLDVFDLPEAIEAKLRDFEVETGIEAASRILGDGSPLGDEASITLYRILQEALTNVARHSMAGTVTVTLEVTAELARLTVEDDGRGITPAEASAETSFGLIGMRERALAAGGHVEVQGRPDHGTRVHAEIPRPCPI